MCMMFTNPTDLLLTNARQAVGLGLLRQTAITNSLQQLMQYEQQHLTKLHRSGSKRELYSGEQLQPSE